MFGITLYNPCSPSDTRMEVIRTLRRTRGPSGKHTMSERLLAGWLWMF
ncbi:MAG: hypothetical protein KKD44_01580 [Proteobacteria bacterium]|nr:hypothetical protein [Pseudomonadota bacterium]